MQIRTAFIILCVFAVLVTKGEELQIAKPESVGMSAEGLLNIDSVMQRHIDEGNIQGAVTAIARRGKVVHYEAHGMMDVDASLPMSKDAIFIMMSSTKPILGVAAMMMIEEGLIKPTDAVSKYIPEFSETQVAVLKEPSDENVSPIRVSRRDPPPHRFVPAETPITIHHLLTHTSGLASGGLGTAVFEGVGQRDSLASYIPKLGSMPLDFQPGSRWQYSGGTGLDVVARIIEIVSETPFDEFLQSRIFNPLKMTDTHYNVPASKTVRRVVIRDRNMARFDRETAYFSGSFGLSSTALDFLHFEQMLLNKGELFGNRLLNPKSVEMLSSNQTGDLYRGFAGTSNGQGFGYTVAVVLDPDEAGSSRGKGAFGWGGAFGTRSWTDPTEQLVGVLMLQQPHGGAQRDFEIAVRAAIID